MGRTGTFGNFGRRVVGHGFRTRRVLVTRPARWRFKGVATFVTVDNGSVETTQHETCLRTVATWN